ncbi:MAG: asparagine synthase (glutamine-hydrolyzing), partial [Alphaproteobacteria bacterium]
MCGIAGLMTMDGRAPDGAVLQRLEAALLHRGPDGIGHYAAGDVAMVQTRLAIIDLKTGDQPLHGSDGLALIANAEIYNHVELRAASPEYNYRTGSDCEPPLYLYRRHGLDFTRHLRGMYAIALHDPAERRLVLARDPFGIKPLYYAETKQGFAFASEPHALIEAGLVQPRVNRARAVELLQLQFTTGRSGVLEGIKRVLPGETIVVSGGKVVERRRLPALPAGKADNIGEDEALRRLDAAFEDSVNVHQRSDVPYGMFLSGGVDSSAVLAMMARLNDRPVRAFTVGFPGTVARDERAHARAVAKEAGAEHVEVAFSEKDFWRTLPEVAAAMDDPAADYATLPTYVLARDAR